LRPKLAVFARIASLGVSKINSPQLRNTPTMAVKIKLTADAYTVGLLYVKPLEMNAMTVILDKKYESIFLCFV
jgi:hypothetical protein